MTRSAIYRREENAMYQGKKTPNTVEFNAMPKYLMRHVHLVDILFISICLYTFNRIGCFHVLHLLARRSLL